MTAPDSTVDLQAPAAVESARPQVRRQWILLALAFGLLWADLIRQLSYMWSTNEQYAFGYFVPLFALALLFRRWQDRPLTSDLRPPTSDLRLLTPVLLCALALLPARIIHEVNQDWALFTWTLALGTVALTLYAVYLADPTRAASDTFSPQPSSFSPFPGSWVKHFAFPICFILVAVRWPYGLENSLTYRLMSVVTVITVELLGWLGVPTVQHGHLIEVATGTVGVDEACSGIRSFQSSIMAGLLMGELYRLRAWPRLFLVGLGAFLAFCFNVARTMFLTWQADAHGLGAIDKWHDSAGLSITVACFLSLWAVALLLQRFSSFKSPEPSSFKSHPSSLVPYPSSLLGSQLSTLNSQRFLILVGAWSLLCILATELWYRSGPDTPAAQTSTWWANFPTNAPGAREIPISKLARAKLNYDHAASLAWEEPDGSQWTAYCFRWDPGATSRMSARDHRPEYCLGGSGYKCNADLGTRYIAAHGLEFPFRAYVYERSGLNLYVFHCIWEDGAEKQEGFGASKYHDRLKAVLDRKRRVGQQTLEIIITGYADMTEAENAFRKRLPDLISKMELSSMISSIGSQHATGLDSNTP